jgi:hypothetical protein
MYQIKIKHNMFEFINKILMVLFFLSLLNSIRHLYYFIQTWFISTEIENVKYRLDNKSLFLLGLSVAYILTTIFTGFKL